MPVSLRVRYPCRQFRPRITEGGLFLVCFCVLATGTKAQTTPSREYIHLGTRVIASENIPPAVAAPTFSPAGGNYNVAQTVAITTSTAPATIRCIPDGTTPTETNGTVGTSGTTNYFGTTDGNGNWTLNSFFDPNNPSGSLGTWQEQAQFPGIVNSNIISFAVNP